MIFESRNLNRAYKSPLAPVAKMVSYEKHSLAKRNGPKKGPDPQIPADIFLEPSTDITVLKNTQSKMQKPFIESTVIADISVDSGDSPPNRATSQKTLPSWSGKTVRKRKVPWEKKAIESMSKKSVCEPKDKPKQKSAALQKPRNLDVRAPRQLKASSSLSNAGREPKTPSSNANTPRAVQANVLNGQSNVGKASIDMPSKDARRSNDAGSGKPEMIADSRKFSVQTTTLEGNETQHELFVSDGDGEELRWPYATKHFQWSPSTVLSSPDILAHTIETGSSPNTTMPEAASDEGPATLDRITPIEVSFSPRAQTLPPSLGSMLGMHSVRNKITLVQMEADAKQDIDLPKVRDGKKVFTGPLPTVGEKPSGPGQREMSSTLEPEAVPSINYKAPSKRGKHPIDIRFFIMESPPPRISLKRWYCHLHDLSAARMFDAVNEMSYFTEVREVKISLETVLPRLNNNWRILRGAESDFNKMREEMRYLIKEAGSEQIKKSRDFRVYIEPIVEEEPDPDTLYGFDAEMLDAM